MKSTPIFYINPWGQGAMSNTPFVRPFQQPPKPVYVLKGNTLAEREEHSKLLVESLSRVKEQHAALAKAQAEFVKCIGEVVETQTPVGGPQSSGGDLSSIVETSHDAREFVKAMDGEFPPTIGSWQQDLPTRVSSILEKDANFKHRLAGKIASWEWLHLDEEMERNKEVMTKYSEFIQKVESLDLPANSEAVEENCLNPHHYLITQPLLELLVVGKQGGSDNAMKKLDSWPGFYLLVFNIIKEKGEEVLVYNYARYDMSYLLCMKHFILKEQTSLIVHRRLTTGGSYFFAWDSALDETLTHPDYKGLFPPDSTLIMDRYIKILAEVFQIFENERLQQSRRARPRPINVIEFIKLALGRELTLKSTRMSTQQMARLLGYTYERKDQEALLLLLELLGGSSEYRQLKFEEVCARGEEIRNNTDAAKNIIHNRLTRLIFIVKDKDSFLEEIKKLNYNAARKVNAGPQKIRGRLSWVGNICTSMDKAFRASLYNHYNHHGQPSYMNEIYDPTRGRVPTLLSAHHFSFKNIHMNSGNVKFFSSSRQLLPSVALAVVSPEPNGALAGVALGLLREACSRASALPPPAVLAGSWPPRACSRGGILLRGRPLRAPADFILISRTPRLSVSSAAAINQKKKKKNTEEERVFRHVKDILSSNPLNASTQEKIELYLREQFKLFSENAVSSQLDIDQSILINGEFREFLLDKCPRICEWVKAKQRDNEDNLLKEAGKLGISWRRGSSLAEHPLITHQLASQSSKGYLIGYIAEVFHTLSAQKMLEIILYNLLYIITFNNLHLAEDEEDDNHKLTLTNLAFEMGKQVNSFFIHYKYREEKLRSKEADYRSFRQQLMQLFISPSSPEGLRDSEGNLVIELGCYLIEVMISAGLIQRTAVSFKSSKHKAFIVEVTDEVKSLVPASLNTPVHIPSHLPMIVPPRPSDGSTSGGYYLFNGEDSLIVPRYNMATPTLIEEPFYTTINNMMSTPFKINSRLLNFLTYCTKYLLPEEHEAAKVKRPTRAQLKALNQFKSKKLLEQYVLKIAHTYADIPEIYFPLKLDQRGRVYPIPIYFHYQGCELAKALLVFARPDILRNSDIKGLEYLMAYGASCYGNGLDKKAFNTRVGWVKDNWPGIIDFEGAGAALVEQAEDKFLYLAFCMEISRYDAYLKSNSSEGFKTELPIQLDGTCNGFQHLAMLSNERELFEKLNLTPSSPENAPQDFYSHVLNLVNGHMQIKMRQDISNLVRARAAATSSPPASSLALGETEGALGALGKDNTSGASALSRIPPNSLRGSSAAEHSAKSAAVPAAPAITPSLSGDFVEATGAQNIIGGGNGLKFEPVQQLVANILSYRKLIDFGLTRSIIKPLVMNKPYNATAWRLEQYLRKALIEIPRSPKLSEGEGGAKGAAGKEEGSRLFKLAPSDPDAKAITLKEISILVANVQEVLVDYYPKLKAFERYLKSMVKLLNELNLPILWRVPTGLTISQQYLEKKTKRIQPFTYLKHKICITTTIPNSIDKAKQLTAFMPNLVHSLDGCTLCLVYSAYYNSLKKDYNQTNVNFFGVHDCYGLSAPFIPLFIDRLRSVYISLYSEQKFIEKFHADIVEFILNSYNNHESYDKLSGTFIVEGKVYKLPDIRAIISAPEEAACLKKSLAAANPIQ